MLVVYDKKGTVYFAGTGFPEPEGIPFLNIEIPEGKMFVGVNVDVEPNQPIFEDIPKTEMQLLMERVEQLEAQNQAIIDGANSIL